MRYDAWSYVRYKGKDGKSDTTLKLYGDYLIILFISFINSY
jgi:hypothetical protein